MPATPNELFSALADPTRRTIIENTIFKKLWSDSEQTVRALTSKPAQ